MGGSKPHGDVRGCSGAAGGLGVAVGDRDGLAEHVACRRDEIERDQQIAFECALIAIGVPFTWTSPRMARWLVPIARAGDGGAAGGVAGVAVVAEIGGGREESRRAPPRGMAERDMAGSVPMIGESVKRGSGGRISALRDREPGRRGGIANLLARLCGQIDLVALLSGKFIGVYC